MKTSLMLLFACFVSAAFAQFDMTQVTSMQSTPAMALMRADIKKELKLTKDQEKEITKLEKDLQNEMRTAGMTAFTKLNEASEKMVAVLDEPQKKRLFEIRIQMRGPGALADSEVAKPLELTQEQQDKVKELQAAFSNDLMAQARSKPSIEQMGKIREAYDAKLLAVLTDTQRSKFKEMQGATFKNARPKGTVF